MYEQQHEEGYERGPRAAHSFSKGGFAVNERAAREKSCLVLLWNTRADVTLRAAVAQVKVSGRDGGGLNKLKARRGPVSSDCCEQRLMQTSALRIGKFQSSFPPSPSAQKLSTTDHSLRRELLFWTVPPRQGCRSRSGRYSSRKVRSALFSARD